MHDSPIEAGSPTDDSRAFRRCLGQYATGVAVITAGSGATRVGVTVNSFAALSLDPPLVLWSLRRESPSLPIFREAGYYGVNVLAADQVATAMRFATPSADKFAPSDSRTGTSGVPLLNGCVAHLECKLHQLVDGGDHVILVGQVEHYARYTGEPLLFAQGRYAIAQDHPDHGEPLSNGKTSDLAALPFETQAASLLRLTNFASHQMALRLERACAELGLELIPVRLFGWLRNEPRSTATLAQLTYLGQDVVRDVLLDMIQADLVVRQPDGLYALTPAGQEKAAQIGQHVSQIEDSIVGALTPSALEQIRRSLITLSRLAASH